MSNNTDVYKWIDDLMKSKEWGNLPEVMRVELEAVFEKNKKEIPIKPGIDWQGIAAQVRSYKFISEGATFLKAQFEVLKNATNPTEQPKTEIPITKERIEVTQVQCYDGANGTFIEFRIHPYIKKEKCIEIKKQITHILNNTNEDEKGKEHFTKDDMRGVAQEAIRLFNLVNINENQQDSFYRLLDNYVDKIFKTKPTNEDEGKLESSIKYAKTTPESYDGAKNSALRFDELSQFSQPEKKDNGWQIISFKKDDFILNLSNGKYRDELNSIGLDNCLKLKLQIHSVLRKSDNQIFSIKNKVLSTWGEQIITGFKISESDSREMIVEFETCRNPLSKIQHLPQSTNEQPKAEEKKVLFVTHDGVGIHEGDKFYPVTDDFRILFSDKADRFDAQTISVKRAFSTKEKAEEYVLMNNQCLSYQDLVSEFSIAKDEKENILKLIKKKLNPQMEDEWNVASPIGIEVHK